MTLVSVWKEKISSVLPWKVKWKLKRIREEWRVWWSSSDLMNLARIYKTDKWRHLYPPIYEQWFGHLRTKDVRLLEIGVGGYGRVWKGGESLRMWKKFFPHGKITGIDIFDKSIFQESRIRIYQGDQSDKQFLHDISRKEGPFDIVVDDGSHLQSHIITSFEALFPLMPAGGTYVIEDTQTSYWSNYEGSTHEMDTVTSAMNYFIQRIHAVNRKEWIKDELKNDLPDEGIASIAFYHNLIFIRKST